MTSTEFSSGYSNVNGLRMYYEIYGRGKPLVLIHGGGSSIHTSFGRIIPMLSKHRQLIGVELQAHGRTNDRATDLSFEQDAEDVVELLKNLKLQPVDILGFSNGGTTALYIAMRYPMMVDKLIVASALTNRSGAPPQFWDFMQQGTLEQMPQAYKDEYLRIAPNPDLQNFFTKCANRMISFKDLPDAEIAGIQAPTLIVIGEQDVMTVDHAREMQQQIPGSQLVILAGGHGAYMGEITTLTDLYTPVTFVAMIDRFLDKQ